MNTFKDELSHSLVQWVNESVDAFPLPIYHQVRYTSRLFGAEELHVSQPFFVVLEKMCQGPIID
jgi:hypothetical protein